MTNSTYYTGAYTLLRDLLGNKAVAENLLSALGPKKILSASRHEVCDVAGAGEATYKRLVAARDLCRQLAAEKLVGAEFKKPDMVREYLAMKCAGLEHEVFMVMFMNNRHRIIAFEELFRGTIDVAGIHPREVVKRALFHNAAAVVLAHNHPSGNATPSDADREITATLQATLALVDVRVLDHFVVGETITSFAEEHLL